MKLEFITAGILIVLGCLILNPFDFWMPTMLHMAVLACAVVTFGAFSVFVLRESADDEREDVHRMFSGRIGFLVGGGVLLIGIVAESFSETLDTWLVAALLAMILGKIAAQIYSSWYR